MGGWKTWISSAISAMAGLIMIGEAIISDPFDPNKLYQGIMAFAAAVGIVGIGHKIEKSSK